MADTRGIRAGRAFVELGVSDKLTAGLRRAQKQLEAFGAGLRSVGTRLAGIGAGAVAALLGTAKAFSDTGDMLDKMSQRTGVSVEALSELGFAADLSGITAFVSLSLPSGPNILPPTRIIAGIDASTMTSFGACRFEMPLTESTIASSGRVA